MSSLSSKVTVLMPVYNGEKYLREAIDSILNQTFTDFEFLIIDDGSRDGSIEIIKSYTDPRIRLIENSDNRGIEHVLNQGFGEAKAQYISRMDCDDISLNRRLELQVMFMEQNPQVDVLGSALRVFGGNGMGRIDRLPVNDNELKPLLLFCGPFAHPTVMFRKSALGNICYASDYKYAEDYDFWTRLAPITKFANLSECLLLYRIHPTQAGSVNKKEQRENARKVRHRFVMKYFNNCSQEQLRIHDLISEHSLILDLKDAENWLKHLLAMNQEMKCFNREGLEKIVSRYWRLSCSMNAGFGLKSLSMYYASTLRRYEKVALLDQARLVLKCLISYSTLKLPSISKNL